MLITDYTIEWFNPYEATLSWTGDPADSWFTVFVDGLRAFSLEDSGSISVTIQVSEDGNHSIAIVQHANKTDNVESPEAVRLLRPTVKWLAQENAATYQVFQLDDDDYEYLVYERQVENGETTDVFSWQFPTDPFIEGAEWRRVRVYAIGSFGTSAVPATVSGFMAGHAPRADSIVPVESSSGIELQISPA